MCVSRADMRGRGRNYCHKFFKTHHMSTSIAEQTNSTDIASLRLTSSALLARNAALNLFTQGWIVLILIVAMPRLVRYLGDTAFGLFSLTWAMVGYLSFLDIGVNRAATKFVSEHLAEQDHASAAEIVRTAVVANLVMGLFGGIAVALFSPFLAHSIFKIAADLQQQAVLAFYAVALAVPILLAQGIFRGVLMSFQRFGLIDLVEILATTVQWGSAALLAWKGHGIGLVVLSAVLARLAAAAVYGVAVMQLFPDLDLLRRGTLHGLKKLIHFGGWVSVSQIVAPLLVYLDRVLIASMVSLAAVTLYTVPFEAMARLRIVPAALVGALYPAFSERGSEKSGEGLQRLYEGSVRYLLLTVLAVSAFLFILGPDLFQVWMGADFSERSSVVVRILVFGVFANALAYVPFNLLQAVGRPDLTGKFHLIELPVYVGSCFLLIPRFGIAGAAVASTIRFGLDCTLLYWAAGKYGRCSVRDAWRPAYGWALLQGGFLALSLLFLKVLTHNPLARVAAGAMVATVMTAAWLIVTLKRERPQQFSNAVRLVLGRVGS